MTENKNVSKCAVCDKLFYCRTRNECDSVCVVALVPSHTFEVLRLPDTFMGVSRSRNVALSR